MSNLIASIERSIKDAPSILKNSDLRTSKVISYKDQLMAATQKEMNGELDESCKKFIVAAKKALKELNEERSPITKQLEVVKKSFTTNEGNIRKAIAEIQQIRDSYLKSEMERKEQERLAAQADNLKEGELIQIKSDVEVDIHKQVQTKIDDFKAKMRKAMDGVTPENAEEKLAKLKELNIDLPKMAELKLSQNVASKYGHDVPAIYMQILDDIYFDLQKHWRTEFQEYKNGCIHLIEKMKTMDAEAQKKEIEKAEQKAQIDSASAMDVVEAQAEAMKDSSQAELAFNAVAKVEEPTPEHRAGWKIIVTNNAGYAALVAYWFATVGKDYNHSFENKTIGSMIKDLQKLDEKLMNDNVKYEPVYKAINRAS